MCAKRVSSLAYTFGYLTREIDALHTDNLVVGLDQLEEGRRTLIRNGVARKEDFLNGARRKRFREKLASFVAQGVAVQVQVVERSVGFQRFDERGELFEVDAGVDDALRGLVSFFRKADQVVARKGLFETYVKRCVLLETKAPASFATSSSLSTTLRRPTFFLPCINASTRAFGESKASIFLSQSLGGLGG